MGAKGTATVDFGSSMSSVASIAVTGQASILSTSHVEAWIMEDSTAGNNALAHKTLGLFARCHCETIVAGTGFTITVLLAEVKATGTFILRWVWD